MGEKGRRHSRRAVLKTTGSVALVGTVTGSAAAAVAAQEDPEDVPDERFESPELPDDETDDLEEIRSFREVFSAQFLGGLVSLSAYVDGTAYEVVPPTDTVLEEVAAEVEVPLTVFVAAKANLEGPAAGFVSPQDIAEQATPVVRTEMEDLGFENVEEVPARDPRPDVEDSYLTELRGTYQIAELEADVEGDDGETTTLRAPEQTIEVAGFQTIWKPNSGTAIVAGGAYPNEDVDVERQGGTDAVGDGLELDPQAYRERLVALTETVE